jgi:tetratricopeptide (TPR) repeat protein
LFRIVNDLAVSLLGELGIEESPRRLESISTSSGVALNEYLKGELALRKGDYPGAIAAFGLAVEADTLFALAWYRMAYTQGFAGEGVDSAVARALELGDRLSERDRRLAEAYLASARVDAERADRLYRLLITDYPDDVEALFGLAEVRIHWGTLAGLSIDSLAESFERVLFFQPDNVEALMHLSWAASMEGDLVKADSAAAELIAVDQGGYFAPIFEVYRAYLQEDSDERLRAAEVLRETDHIIRVNGVAMVSTLPDLAGATTLTAELFRDPALIPEIRAFGHILEAHLELARGRWAAAQERLADAATLDPVPALEARALLSLAPFLDLSRSYLEDLRSELEEWDAAAVPPGTTGNPWIEPNDGFHEELRLYLLGALSARLGDTERARQLASELEPSDTSTAEAEFALTLSHNLRALAWLAENRPEEAVREFEQAKPISLWERTYSSALFSQSYERYLRAEALEAVGRTDEALRWYTSVWVQNSFDRVYWAVSHLRKGEIFERAGDNDRALEEYSQVVELWRDADPEFQERLSEVLERIRQLRD